MTLKRDCDHLENIHERTCGKCDCNHPNRFADVLDAGNLEDETESQFTFTPNFETRVVVVVKNEVEIMNIPFDLIKDLNAVVNPYIPPL